jgi:hypothetical protein
MSDDLTIRLEADQYVLRRERDTVRLGRRNGDDVAWLDEVDTSLFSSAALEALDRGDASDESLLTALRGVAQAEVERGG